MVISSCVVVRLSIQILIGVGGLPIYTVLRGAIWSFVYVNVEEGKWLFESLSMVKWMVG